MEKITPSKRPWATRGATLAVAAVGTFACLTILVGCGQPPMPDLSGLDAAQAATALRAAEFDSRFTWEESSDEPGLVTGQHPAPGQPDPDPRVVDVTVSSGTPFSADDALGSDWEDAFPLGQSNTPDDDQGSAADQCSALDDVPSDGITAEGLMVDPYLSPSGVGGGTLLVSVRLLRTASTSAAETLLASNREAQAACAGSAGSSDYNTLPDAGASGNTIEYAAETVAGYPALRTDGFFVVASPSLGGGVGTMFRLTVAWRQGRNLVEVTRTEIFGQTLPPRVQGVPDDIVQAVQALESSVGAEVNRSRANASALSAAKQALKQAKSATGGASTTGSQGHTVSCESIERTNMSELTARGLSCPEARRLARFTWFHRAPDGFKCKYERKGESSHTVCMGTRGTYGYWSFI